jgi:polysaccharide biosynthesis/export protein
MFNSDGTHRADADIATDVARAIQELIKEGIIKPQDAPAKPIKGFDDANKYLDNYPTGPSGSPASAPRPTAPGPTAPVPTATGPTAPANPAPCPADRPWLCEAPPPAPVAKAAPAPTSVKAPATTAANGPAKTSAPVKSSDTKPAAGTGSKPKSTGSKSAATGSKPAAAPADEPLYVLGPNDVVGVTVFDEPRVSATYSIGPDGRMSMPLIGNFKAIDMTIPELTVVITEKLKDPGGILDPVVNVQLLRNNSKQYTLVGGTARTGPVPLLRETTIFDALVAAGFKDFANKKNIILRRGTKEFHFNYNQVVKGQHMEQNILIEDGDFIIVKD